MKKIATKKAPAAIGPYSQAIQLDNGMIMLSGQIALLPETGQLAPGGIKAECQQVMQNIYAVLSEAGYDWTHVVKTTIFLTTMDDFAQVNSIYGEYLAETAPARSTIAVAALPKGASVEIEVTAYKKL